MRACLGRVLASFSVAPTSMRLALLGFGLGFGVVLGVQFAAPQVAVSADLQTIQARGHLIVAVKDNWRPLGFRSEAGELIGLEIDIARQLAYELLGNADAVILKPVSNADRLTAVLEDQVDLAIAGVAATPARTRLVSFSLPYYLDGTALVTRRADLQDLQGAAGRRIAVIENSDAIATVRYLLPSAILVNASSYQAAFERLEANSADALAADATILSGWVQEHPEYRLLPPVLSAEPLAVVMPKGTEYSPLRRAVDEAIGGWHDSGWLEARATYWGLP